MSQVQSVPTSICLNWEQKDESLRYKKNKLGFSEINLLYNLEVNEEYEELDAQNNFNLWPCGLHFCVPWELRLSRVSIFRGMCALVHKITTLYKIKEKNIYYSLPCALNFSRTNISCQLKREKDCHFHPLANHGALIFQDLEYKDYPREYSEDIIYIENLDPSFKKLLWIS